MSSGGEHDTGPIQPISADEVDWTDETDVIVVGLGCAGACAAISAAESGLDVIALERMAAGGGTSAMSGGLIYLGGGTATQVAAGVTDDVESMQTFLAAVLGLPIDDPRLAAYCAGSVEHHDWLVDHGLEIVPEVWPEPGLEPPGEQGLVYSGGEDTLPFAAIAAPAPRAHIAKVPGAGGARLMEVLLAAVRRVADEPRPGEGTLRVRTSARADRLVVDGEGRVVGLVGRVDGEPVAIAARRGVVLAAGGFAFHDALVDQHVPQVNRVSFKLGTDADDGWALRVGTGVGGALVNMAQAEVALPITPPRRLVQGVVVDGQGRRFINEDAYYGHVGHRALFEHDGHAFLIVDEPRHVPVNFAGFRAAWVCETYEELEAELGLPTGSLTTTMTAYNAAAADGHDPEFHKAPEFVVPLTEGPFGAYDLRVEHAIYAAFPLGGLAIDVDGRVLDDAGSAVPGLFAVGRSASSMAREWYCSGISLGEGTFTGRRAGAALAAG
jgi:3-oxo-5alpha-steroid 4-dehydrogenase